MSRTTPGSESTSIMVSVQVKFRVWPCAHAWRSLFIVAGVLARAKSWRIDRNCLYTFDFSSFVQKNAMIAMIAIGCD